MIEWLARHRMALSIVFGILVPYPGSYVPIGLIFAVLLPTGGYWAIGIFAGGGGPSLLLFLGAIALAYAAAFWALTTVVLRRMFRVGLPWWPPRSPPVPWETLPRRTLGPQALPDLCPECGARYPSRYYFAQPDQEASVCAACASVSQHKRQLQSSSSR